MARSGALLNPRALLRAAILLLALFSLAACGGGDDTGDDDDSTLEVTPTPTAAELNRSSQAGDFALDFLSSSLFPKLVVEIDVMDGSEPDQSALDSLMANIEMLCNKPGGVTFLPVETIPSSGQSNPEYTLTQINGLEEQYRQNYTMDDTAVLYFLYVDGHSSYDEGSSKVVGYAYHGSSMAVFMGTVKGQPLLIQPTLLKTVTVHEFGHELGLVDDGTPMVTPHKDPDHGPHCNNSSCIMYWTNNGSAINVISGEVSDFDDNCLSDIAAAGGKDARGLQQPD